MFINIIYLLDLSWIISSPTNSFSSDVISNVSETKERTTSLKLNLEEKPDSHGSPRTSDEEEGLVSKERGLRPETAPAVNFPHKADEEETRRSYRKITEIGLRRQFNETFHFKTYICSFDIYDLFREKKLTKRPKTAPAPAQEKKARKDRILISI